MEASAAGGGATAGGERRRRRRLRRKLEDLAAVAAVLASVQRAAIDRIERRADASSSTDPRAWRGWRRGDGWHLGEPREIRAVLDRDGVNRGDVVCARGAPYEHIYSEADALIRKLTR